MDKQQPPSAASQAVFRDLRARDKRRDRVAKLLQAQRKRRISGIEAQLERWTRQR